MRRTRTDWLRRVWLAGVALYAAGAWGHAAGVAKVGAVVTIAGLFLMLRPVPRRRRSPR